MDIICLIVQAYQLVLIARVVFSWVPRPPEPLRPLVRFVTVATDPLVVPIRRVMPAVPIGGVSLDVSIIVVFFALEILRQAVC